PTSRAQTIRLMASALMPAHAALAGAPSRRTGRAFVRLHALLSTHSQYDGLPRDYSKSGGVEKQDGTIRGGMGMATAKSLPGASFTRTQCDNCHTTLNRCGVPYSREKRHVSVTARAADQVEEPPRKV